MRLFCALTLPVALMLFLYGLVASAAMTESQYPSSDLSDKFPPIRNQGAVGLCYAFTAADLLGYYQGLPAPQGISAIDVGVNFMGTTPDEMQTEVKKHSKEFSTLRALNLKEIPALEKHRKRNKNYFLTHQAQIGGGYIALAALAYQKSSGGICLEEKLVSEGSFVDKQSPQFVMERMNRAMDFGYKGIIDYRWAQAIYKPGQKQIPEWTINPPSLVCPPRPASNVKNLELLFPAVDELNKKAMEGVRADFAKACGDRSPIKPFKVSTLDLPQHENSPTALIVAAALKAGTPVGIDYESSFLRKGSASPLAPSDHASSLVGARWNKETNTCEFKLRNSWGRGCNYAPEYKKDCDEGYIWISEKDVNLRVSKLTAITPP